MPRTVRPIHPKSDIPSPGPKIPPSTKKNFKTLQAAFAAGHVAIMRCIRKSDQRPVTLICTVSLDPSDGQYQFTPFAEMLAESGNPFEDYEPPTPDREGKKLTGERL